jgi:hypothetical protein
MEFMKLDELVNNYRSMAPSFKSWQITLEEMLADPFERFTVEGLAAELKEHGFFRKPVMLGAYEQWADDSKTEDEDVLLSTEPAVENGTHRVCAHLLAGVDDVHVHHLINREAATYNDEVVDGIWRMASTEIVIDIPFKNVNEELSITEHSPADADFNIWEALMSLRLSDEHWTTSDSAGSRRDGNKLFYDMTWDGEALLEPYDVLNQKLVAKLEHFGFVMKNLTIRTFTETYDEDDPEADFIALDDAVSNSY